MWQTIYNEAVHMYGVAYGALAQIDPNIIRAILLGSIAIGCVLFVGWAGHKINQIPAVRRWGEARTMKRRRMKLLHEMGADIIQDGLDKKLKNKQITPEEWDQELRKYARLLNMQDLVPKTSVETTKTSIRWRLTNFIPFIGKIPGPKPGEQEGKAKKKTDEVMIFQS